MIIELAEQGEPRFLTILRDHVKTGAIRAERAAKAIESAGANADFN
jgi:hypothetical protein